MWSVTTSHRRQQTWSPADCQSHIIPLVRAGRQQFELTQFCQISAAHDITTCSAGDAVASILHTGYAQLSACSEFNQCWFSVVPTVLSGSNPWGQQAALTVTGRMCTDLSCFNQRYVWMSSVQCECYGQRVKFSARDWHSTLSVHPQYSTESSRWTDLCYAKREANITAMAIFGSCTR